MFHFHTLEKEKATDSSVLAWRIPGMEEPGGLPSLGSHRIRHDEATWQQQQVFVSLVAVSGGYSLEQCTGFSLRWLLLWWSTGSRAHGFSTGAPEHGLTRCGPWTQLPLLHVGSSQTRDQTSVSCMARQILNYWTTQEVHTSMFNSPFWILATFPIFPLRPGAGVITALL